MAAGQAPGREAPTLMSDGQRIVVAGMFAAGLTFFAIGMLMAPRDALFWVAFFLAPLFMATIAGILAIAPGRRLDARLLAGGGSAKAARPVAASALPEPARQALRVALVPALLGELARESARMAPPEKAAAGRLIEAAAAAWNAAPDAAARLALAQALPRLVGGLVAGGQEAIRAAEQMAARLAAGSAR